jgi:hypothetical protein
MEPEMVERAHGVRKIRETDYMIKAAALVAVLALSALAPSAPAATPDIHAHRGGTVQNGTARFGEESIRAYRNAALHGFVLTPSRSPRSPRCSSSPASRGRR